MTPSRDQIIEALQALVNAKTWAERKQIVEDHRDVLLTEAADEVFAATLTHYRDEEGTTRIIEEDRALLARCRREGIDAAFTDLVAPGEPSAAWPKAVVDAVLAFAFAQTQDEGKQIIEAHDDVLLTDAADRAMAYLLTQYEEDENAIRTLIQRRALLARCRREGIEAAFADPVAQSALEILLAFVNAQTWSESKQIVEVYRDVLLTNAADEALISLLKQYKEDEDVVRQLEGYRALLALCRSDGIEAAFADLLPSPATCGESELEALLQELEELTKSLDDMPRSVAVCRAALEMVSRDSQPELWAVLQGQLANSLNRNPLEDRAENLEGTIRHYNQALKVYTQENFPEQWAGTQNNLGTAYFNRIRENRAENLERAIYHYNRALEIKTQQNFPQDWAMIQSNLGGAYRNRIREDRAENLEQAIRHHEQALKVCTQQDFPEQWARTQNNLGNAYVDRVREDRAENLEQAIRHYKQALEVCTQEDFPQQWADIQNNLGNAYSSRIREDRAENLERAIYHYQHALKIRTPTMFPQHCRNIAYSLGNLLYDERRFADARVQFTTAHGAVEALRGEIRREGAKRDLAEQNAILYARLVHCCLIEDDEVAAFEYAVAGKGRAFVDLLSTARFDLSAAGADDPKLAEDLRKTQELRWQIDDLLARLGGEGDGLTFPDEIERRSPGEMRAELRALYAQEARVWEDMAYSYPELTATQQAPAFTVEEACTLAGELEATLVEYYQHAGGWCAFIITPEEVRHVSLPKVDDLESMGKWFRWIESPGTLGPLSYGPLRQLHEAVITPLRPHLPLDGRVVLAPFYWLHLVPLGAALDPKAGRYAAEDYRLAFSPSLAALRMARAQSQRGASSTDRREVTEHLLSVAYPDKPGSKYHLPNVLPEAEAVAKHFARITRLHEDDATPEAVLEKARGQALIHLGCHGLFDLQYPGQSGLKLSGGWLTVQGIITRLRLDRTRLMTIGACLSGRVDVRRGEEHVGLMQAMMSAGAASVVASLWPVDDAATRALFEVFYAEVASGDSAAGALAKAGAFVRSRPEWGHPYYWAAFQVSGLAHGPYEPGLSSLSGEVLERIEDAHRESMETRGGSVVDGTSMVKDSLILLEQMSEEPEAVLEALGPDDREKVIAGLGEISGRAEGVRTEADLLGLADAVHRLVESTPALADLLLEPGSDPANQRALPALDETAHDNSESAREHAVEIRNRVVECRERLERNLQSEAEEGP